jgi:hypothetical protein
MAIHYASPTGSTGNTGTIGSPWPLSYACDSSRLLPGDTLWVRGGTYNTPGNSSSTTHFYIADLLGTSGSPISIENYPGEVPVLNVNVTPNSGMTYAFGVMNSSCSYLTIKGLQLTGLPQTGTMAIAMLFTTSSNHITIENCNIHNVGGVGFSCNNSTYVTYKNCDASYCLDPNNGFENANGFNVTGGVQLNSSDNIVFDGCRAWKNADDGFDFYGVDAYITMNNCWSFYNGYNDAFGTLGNGQGYKLGPFYTTNYNNVFRRKLTNCIATGNRTGGFDKNLGDLTGGGSCKTYFYNCLAYGNGGWGWAWTYGTDEANIFANNIAYGNGAGTILKGSNNIESTNSWSSTGWAGISVSNADFQGLSIATLTGARGADGSLPVLSFGKLASGSGLIHTGTTVAGFGYDALNIPWASPKPSLGPYEDVASGGNVLVTSVTVSGTSGASTITINGGTLQMTATVLPANATDKTVVWSVINGTGQATISSTGLLTAVRNGTVTVVATANG